MKALSLMFICVLLSACTTVQEETKNEEISLGETFCGTSTESACTSDADCIQSGCSGQICQSTSEEERITTCEYQDCYNAESYSLSCTCHEQKCSWG